MKHSRTLNKAERFPDWLISLKSILSLMRVGFAGCGQPFPVDWRSPDMRISGAGPVSLGSSQFNDGRAVLPARPGSCPLSLTVVQGEQC